SQAPYLGDRFPEQLQVLAENVRADAVGHPGDVSARMRKARDEPEPDWIGETHSHDWDRPSGALGRQGCRRRYRCDDVDLEPDQLGCESREPVELALRRSKLDDDIPALNPAELAQPLRKRRGVARAEGARAGGE